MEHSSRKPIVVIGVGNNYRADDGVGPAVARRLATMNLRGAAVREENGEGAALMEAWKDAEHVIIVDATSSGSVPGTIHRIDANAQRIPPSFFHYSSHAFSVAEAIELARALNQLPSRLILLGIEGKNFAAGIGLSPEVERSCEEVFDMVTDEIAATSCA